MRLADVRPGIAFALVGCNARLDVMVGEADRLADFDAALGKFAGDETDHLVGRGGFGTAALEGGS